MEHDTKKVSYVIPAYNALNTLVEAIDSIFHGNFQTGDEVIIVNDASEDTTADVIESLQKKYPPIIVIHNHINIGCPASRNVGIGIAQNPLIFNLDADNVLVPGAIASLKKCLLHHHADIAAFGEIIFFTDTISTTTHSWLFEKDTMTMADFLAGPVNPGPDGNFLYTRASWEKIGGYWEYGKGLHEAWGFTLKQLASGAIFAVAQDAHYFHRYGNPSLFTTESEKKDESSLMATKMIMNVIDLIDDNDAAYIKSEEGSRKWFAEFAKRPIHLKSREVGTPGRIRVNVLYKIRNLLIRARKLLLMSSSE